MRTWYFAENEPILDELGNIKIIEGLESLAENIDQRLLLFKGKYFLDISAGVPYLQDILIKPVDPGLVASILNAEIQKESEVTGLGEVAVDLDPGTREFDYQATVKSVFGPLEVDI